MRFLWILRQHVFVVDGIIVEIKSPDGGEVLSGGSVEQIRWKSYPHPSLASYTLLLSTDGGTSYPETIAYNLSPAETSYAWTVPNINSTTCRVRIEALDASDSIIDEDESNGNFSIVPSGISDNPVEKLAVSSLGQEIIVEFYLSKRCDVSIRAYNLYGRMVKEIHKEKMTVGHHVFKWNPHLPGVYFIKLNTGREKTEKVMVIK